MFRGRDSSFMAATIEMVLVAERISAAAMQNRATRVGATGINVDDRIFQKAFILPISY